LLLISWTGWVFAILAVFLARPVALWLSFLRSGLGMREQAAAMWFGPKGFASVVYGLLVLESGIAMADKIFHLVVLTIVLSILLHTSTDVVIARAFVEEADVPAWYGVVRRTVRGASRQPRATPSPDHTGRGNGDCWHGTVIRTPVVRHLPGRPSNEELVTGVAMNNTEPGNGWVAVPSQTADTAVVELHGDIDITTAEVLEDCVVAGVTRGADVFIDMADVTLIDGASLGALVRAGRFADRRGRSIRLVTPSPLVRRILAAAGLGEDFPVTGDRWQALGELAPEHDTSG
jgi:anti-anti-sigma factor